MLKRIHKLLFYTVLFSVYGIFFSVQTFFNFEGQLNTKDIFKYSSLIHFSGSHESVVKTSPLKSSSAHRIRLNKRFHQEESAPCPVIVLAPPPSLPIPKVLGSYRTPELPSVAVVHYPLRGPPVVA